MPHGDRSEMALCLEAASGHGDTASPPTDPAGELRDPSSEARHACLGWRANTFSTSIKAAAYARLGLGAPCRFAPGAPARPSATTSGHAKARHPPRYSRHRAARPLRPTATAAGNTERTVATRRGSRPRQSRRAVPGGPRRPSSSRRWRNRLAALDPGRSGMPIEVGSANRLVRSGKTAHDGRS
jgi:hypothetical protein